MGEQKQQQNQGVLARFASAESLLTACRAAKARNISIDAYAPYPVAGLADLLAPPKSYIRATALVSGVLAALFFFTLQAYSAAVDYPYRVGGKPPFSWLAFFPVSFAMGLLFAALGAVIRFFYVSALPEPWHPVFESRRFDSASVDGFFLFIAGEPEHTIVFLETLPALEVIPLQW